MTIIQKTPPVAGDLAITIAQFAEEKKALDILILDMRDVVNFCDYFVICSGNTDRQVKAIAEHIDEELDRIGVKLHYKPRDKSNSWVVFDAGDVVTHVFLKKLRDFYNLEYLWSEAKRVTPVAKASDQDTKE